MSTLFDLPTPTPREILQQGVKLMDEISDTMPDGQLEKHGDSLENWLTAAEEVLLTLEDGA